MAALGSVKFVYIAFTFDQRFTGGRIHKINEEFDPIHELQLRENCVIGSA
jgi:hypothetical protein